MAKKTMSFAHLLGFGKSASEEDEDKKTKKSKARKAEEDDREDDAEDDERDDDAEDDDGDDRKESKSGRQACISERKRCARIFGSPHAAANPALAASLAFYTGMSSAAAINVMASQAPASQPKRGRSLDERMQASHQARLNPDGEKQTGKSALVGKMTSLYNSVKGEK